MHEEISRKGRPLPPLNALRAFEAIARHLSFAKAAAELHVTPAALSHQIRGLEQEVGPLFHRRTRAIELTETGRLLYPGLHAGFESVRNALAQLDRTREGRVLVVTATPGLVAKWLMPRLWRFLRAHPDIDARVAATMKIVDFNAEGVDLGIRLSKRVDPDLHTEKLFDDTMLPVCSPRLVEQGLHRAADLARFPLIHYDFATSMHAPPVWADWFPLAGLQGADAPTRGLRVSAADHALGGRGRPVPQADRVGRRACGASGDAVRPRTAARLRLLLRLPEGARDAPKGARLTRLAVRRDGGDEAEMGRA
jgi:LysR family glycine cleavage system transcriptional activator